MARGFMQFLLVLTLMVFSVAGSAQAQTGQVFVQIEAHPDLATTETRVRAYVQLVPDVRAYRLQTGWYGIAVGPLSPAEAAGRLAELSNAGIVPGDAYVENRPIYVQQVFPVGADQQPVETPEVVEAAEPAVLPDETPAQARQSEAQLDRSQREALQIALQWFGFYNSGIDGAFGPGTRAAMQAWQLSQGLEQTGVLTTRQRRDLLNGYRDELAALGMRIVTDSRAGVEMNMPMAMVEFGRYEFPFAQYDAINDSGVRVFLISQEGTSRTLAGLYEIMQTLEIVPLDGERSRSSDRFVLTGRSASLRSYTEARLQDGQIKGFTIIWPPERDAEIDRVLPMMQDSFAAIPGVLDPGAVSEETLQGVNLLAGLDVRQPELRRTGFFVSGNGVVATTAEIAQGQCTRILIDDIYEAEILSLNAETGLAILAPRQALAPVAFGRPAETAPRRGSQIAVAGFPYEGALGAASLNIGALEELTGLNGESTLRRLSLDTEPAEAGGPVLDGTGQVVGMLLPQPTSGRTLPPGVAFAVSSDVLGQALADQGLLPETDIAASPATPLGAQALARLGSDMTVLVSCWN